MKAQLHGPANVWYLEAVEELLHDGQPVVSRGRAVHEALHTVLTLPNPRQRVLTVPYRRANPFFQAAETVWILAGRADARWITAYNSQLSQFLDGGPGVAGEYFHGAYGERLRQWGTVTAVHHDSLSPKRDQLQGIIDQLTADPGSRRAVAVLHNPDVDYPEMTTKDRPCNIALSAQLRDGKLHLAVFNRSNDITLGLAYTNIVQFTTIQEVLACALGVGLGTYTHFSSSLHLYDDDKIARRCLDRASHEFNIYEHTTPTPMVWWQDEPRLAAVGFTWWEALANVLDPEAPVGTSAAMYACPYWGSVVRLLRAWRLIKSAEGDGLRMVPFERALELLSGMEARDWQVAALEFCHRWAFNRSRIAANLVLTYAKEHAPNDACYQYIAHDDGR